MFNQFLPNISFMSPVLLTFLAVITLQACDEEGLVSSSSEQEALSAGQSDLPMPIEDCVGPENISDHVSVQATSTMSECITCEGSLAPDFKLRDFNPSSCGVGKYYGLDAFQGQVTFVVLLRSTCGYCMAQLEKLEQIRYELLVMGLNLNMLVINERGTQAQIVNLTQRAQIPIFQDVDEVMAWEALSSPDPNDDSLKVGGDKDDMYIYDSTGHLWRFLDDDDPSHKLNLSTDEGYNYLKEILIMAINEAP